MFFLCNKQEDEKLRIKLLEAGNRKTEIAGIRTTEKLTVKPEPVSIEELSLKHNSSAKPKFLSKEGMNHNYNFFLYLEHSS